jgi:hypothetical protein
MSLSKNARRNIAYEQVRAEPSLATLKVLRGAAACLRATSVKEIAAQMGEPLKSELTKSSNQTIDAIIDEYCGTPHPSRHNPWALPASLALELATVLVVYANTKVQAGSFKTELLRISTKMAEKAFQER